VSVHQLGQKPPVAPSHVPVTCARSLAQAYAVLSRREPGLVILAGGTDVMVRINARVGMERLGPVLEITRVPELQGISVSGEGHSAVLRLGALTTYAQLMASALVRAHLPALAQVSREIGAWAIQNRGTLGGNVCNASPAGDTLPILLAADARFVVGGPRGERAVAARDFFVSYRKTCLAADELLLQLEVPIDPALGRVVYRKVGTRRAQSISKVMLAVRGTVLSGQLSRVRVAAGCVAPIPVRCLHAEGALDGRFAEPEVLAAAAVELQKDLAPIDDVRSTAGYRRRVAGNVLVQLVGELLQGAPPPSLPSWVGLR
jgi:CO/xanthine dehydrogenase FAD-binding subunit